MERDLIIHYFSVETIHEIFFCTEGVKAADYHCEMIIGLKNFLATQI